MYHKLRVILVLLVVGALALWLLPQFSSAPAPVNPPDSSQRALEAPEVVALQQPVVDEGPLPGSAGSRYSPAEEIGGVSSSSPSTEGVPADGIAFVGGKLWIDGIAFESIDLAARSIEELNQLDQEIDQYQRMVLIPAIERAVVEELLVPDDGFLRGGLFKSDQVYIVHTYWEVDENGLETRKGGYWPADRNLHPEAYVSRDARLAIQSDPRLMEKHRERLMKMLDECQERHPGASWDIHPNGLHAYVFAGEGQKAVGMFKVPLFGNL
jgi:hypothetical protein